MTTTARRSSLLALFVLAGLVASGVATLL